MSNETGFNVGDVVQLNSGGPVMTVQKLVHPNEQKEEDAGWRVQCTWFDGGEKRKFDDFEPELLTKLDMDEEGFGLM